MYLSASGAALCFLGRYNKRLTFDLYKNFYCLFFRLTVYYIYRPCVSLCDCDKGDRLVAFCNVRMRNVVVSIGCRINFPQKGKNAPNITGTTRLTC